MVFERKQLGRFLRDRRIAKGMSQSIVSSELGYTSPQFVSNWERGISAPPLKALCILSRVYQIPAQEIIDVIVAETVDVLQKELSACTEEFVNPEGLGS